MRSLFRIPLRSRFAWSGIIKAGLSTGLPEFRANLLLSTADLPAELMSNFPSQTELLITALQSLPIGVITTDVRGIVLSMNAVFTSLTGYAAEEVVGQPISQLSFVSAHPNLSHIIQAVIESREPWRGNWVWRKKTGEPVAFDQSVLALNSAGGETLHVLVTIHVIASNGERGEAPGLERGSPEVTAPGRADTITIGSHRDF